MSTTIDVHCTAFFAMLENASAKMNRMATIEEASVEERIVAAFATTATIADVKMIMTVIRSDLVEAAQTEVVSKPPVQPSYTCDMCGSQYPDSFVLVDNSIVCIGENGAGCGNVLESSRLFEGNAYRRFEDEEDRSHHGPAPNPLFSSAYNLKVNISKDGAGAAALRRTLDTVEMNCSEFDLDSRQTRMGYKDQMKRFAFKMIDDIGANLELHHRVLAVAKLTFARFRNHRAQIRHLHATIAACVLLALPATRPGPSFTCATCGAVFNAKRALRFHSCARRVSEVADAPEIEMVVEKPKSAIEFIGDRLVLPCYVCPRVFSTLAALEVHMARHANSKRKSTGLSDRPLKQSIH
ncbi:hypothetical protein ACHHYP_20639 [Achlya hypogyna]|uniref:C2H2-type domain-containing protein n=1 Tax=Achlya hypogyna TaxID=1202772 RepID=A0A1V9ZG89_ACHHY|nr:hypothetical protein ACHHYP_20639 [Achlya hypogyna]